jgi:hypothetical protein
MKIVRNLPWWVKLGTKLALSRLPVPYGFWRRLGIFRHGAMNDPELAIRTFRRYFDRANAKRPIPSGFCSLELGPGDSVLAGIAAKAFGARKVYLVDTGTYAESNVGACHATAARLRASGLTLPDIADATSLADILERCGISYLTGGVSSFSAIPDGTVDFCWSQAVLEHVYRDEFPSMLRELRRVMAKGAVGLHGVDFRDHLASGLNNLRFREQVWESRSFRRGGFYTNRIQCHVMMRLFEEAGFEVEVLERNLWPVIPLPRRKMAPPFREMDEDQLRVADAELLIRPRR